MQKAFISNKSRLGVNIDGVAIGPGQSVNVDHRQAEALLTQGKRLRTQGIGFAIIHTSGNHLSVVEHAPDVRLDDGDSINRS